VIIRTEYTSAEEAVLLYEEYTSAEEAVLLYEEYTSAEEAVLLYEVRNILVFLDTAMFWVEHISSGLLLEHVDW